jgi:predicted dehydrogenase
LKNLLAGLYYTVENKLFHKSKKHGSNMKKQVKIGIIGVGSMGLSHVYSVHELENTCLTAVCDIDPAKFDRIKPEVKDNIQLFTSSEEFFAKADMEAVIISVPHYDHVPLAIEALKHGKHILVEKPISVEKKSAMALLNTANNYPDLVKCLMLCQRTQPPHIKLKRLIDSGELGTIKRINWIVTDWFRSQFYYDSGDWRASWRGEGGGVLLNQCPHQLDMLQWFFGMPTKIHAFTALGKYHDIEVEDEISALIEFESGATGVFIASTGEAPGTNRLEIAATRGKVVYENGEIKFFRNEIPDNEFSRTSQKGFAKPEIWNVSIPFTFPPKYSQHREVSTNFADVILNGGELVAPLTEGIRSLEIGNAMLLSGLTGETIELPIDADRYAEMLAELIKTSRYQKKSANNCFDETFRQSFL